MDESLVDIILILLAGLVAVSVVPKFQVEPPDSTEVTEGAQELLPLQVAVSPEGDMYTGSPPQQISAQQLYDLVIASDPNQTVEFSADQGVSARHVIEINQIVQQAAREAVMIVTVK